MLTVFTIERLLQQELKPQAILFGTSATVDNSDQERHQVQKILAEKRTEHETTESSDGDANRKRDRSAILHHA